MTLTSAAVPGETMPAASQPTTKKSPRRQSPAPPAVPAVTAPPPGRPSPAAPQPVPDPSSGDHASLGGVPSPAARTAWPQTPVPSDGSAVACEPDTGTVSYPSPAWPLIDHLGLSGAALQDRRGSIGGSDANVIFSGSPERVLRLWREKRGEDAPEELSGNLAVMLGCWSEPFNRQWYERASGERVSRVGERVTCTTHPWRSATLDGYLAGSGAVWEAKHTNAFTRPEDVLTRYMPQLQHNMAVARCERAVLSVIFGNAKWEVFEIAADWLYQEDLLAAEAAFWACVQEGKAPVAAPAPPAPKPIGVREVCLQGSNAWAAAAADWLQHRAAARTHQAATTTLKSLVEPDVARAFGHGIEARRSKAGALSIRELEG